MEKAEIVGLIEKECEGLLEKFGNTQQQQEYNKRIERMLSCLSAEKNEILEKARKEEEEWDKIFA